MKIDQPETETANFKIIELNGGPYNMGTNSFTKAAKQYGCDVLHCTSNTAPFLRIFIDYNTA
jgi:hypothetical protein